MNAPAKKRLGELLIDAGVIDETQLKAALGHQRQWGVRLGQALVDLKLATEHDVVKVLAKRFGFEVARFDQVEAYAHQQAISLVPREFALKHNVFPMAADTATLGVAMSDPTNLAVIDELRFRSGRRVKVTIGGDREIAAAIQAAYPSPDGGVEAIALDIDESGDEGESVMDSFGGGSNEDFQSFFGTDAAHLHGHEDAAAPESPFAAGPAVAPENPFAAGPAVAPVPAPVPATQAAPALAPSAAAPQSATPLAPAMPAAPAPPRPAPARLASAPAAAAPAPTARPAPAPTARPAPVAPARPPAPGPTRAPTVPAVRAIPAPTSVPAAPAARPAPPAPGRVSRPTPAPIRAVPPPGTAAPRISAAAIPVDLELPSPDALQDARARTGQAAPAAPGERVEGELSPLAEDSPPPASPDVPFTPGEQTILDALQRLAQGGHAEPDVLKPTQAIAVMIRILMRKGMVTPRELLDALKKNG